MKIIILPPGEGVAPLAGAVNGEHLAAADAACPGCGKYPLMVEGQVPHVVVAESHRHCTEWEAVTACCNQPGWTIGVERTSIFGFEEDAEVLNGRPRVYG